MDLFDALEDWQPRRRIVQDIESLSEAIKILKDADFVGFDVETTPIPKREKFQSIVLLGIGLASKDFSCYIPVNHYTKCPQLDKELIIEELNRHIFSNPNILKVAHNLKFDMAVLKQNGGIFVEPFVCTQIMSWLLDETGIHGLKPLAYRELGIKMKDFKQINGGNLREANLYEVAKYCRMDAKGTLLLFHKFYEKLEEERLLPALKLESLLVPVVADMEIEGMTIDTEALDELRRLISPEVIRLRTKIYDIAGKHVNNGEPYVFNVDSPPQLGNLLFNLLGLTNTVETPDGKMSTDFKALNSMKDQHEIIEPMLEYRKLRKMETTYTDGFKDLLVGNKIYGEFNQMGTETGRFSSRRPNLQNITRDSEDDDGIKFRKIFVAPKGYKLLVSDYSQLEMRILAHFSRDPNLMDAFMTTGLDVHKATAALMFGVKYEDVTKQQRQIAKNINFGLSYGAGPQKLATMVGCTEEYAKEMFALHHAKYQGIIDWKKELIKSCKRELYVRTLIGRKRHLIEINAEDNMHRSHAERECVNFVIQGCIKYDQTVLTKEGYTPICDLKYQPIYDGVGWTNNYTVYESGEKVCYVVTFKDGRQIQTSEEHVFLKWNTNTYRIENRRLKDLNVDDIIIAPNILAPSGKLPIDIIGTYNGRGHCKKITQTPDVQPNEAYLLGYLVGDGYYKEKRGFSIAVGDKQNAVRLTKLIEETYPDVRVRLDIRTKERKNPLFKLCCDSILLRDRLLRLGLDYVSKKEKRVPKWIYNAPPEYRARFLQGYYDADGTFTKNGMIYLTTVVKELAHGVFLLLNSLGIQSGWKIYSNKSEHSYSMKYNKVPLMFYRVEIGRKTVEQFINIVGFGNLLKLDKATKWLSSWNKNGFGNRQGFFTIKGFSPIVSIEPIGCFKTFDIEIYGDNHAYVCEGLLVHNSAADIAKAAMIKIYKDDLLNSFNIKTISQIHDEVVLSCPESKIDEAMNRVKELMEHPFNKELDVPLIAEVGFGDNWSQAK